MPVKVVVTDSMDRMIFNSGKFVLLEIYAPWCGHCKSLEPIYKELAEKLLPFQDKITIAKMDGTKNEHEILKIKGFPTILLYRPDDKKFKDYEGQRTIEGFMTFLQKETGLRLSEVKTAQDMKEEVEVEL